MEWIISTIDYLVLQVQTLNLPMFKFTPQKNLTL
jgi:hypothetical protein